MWPSKVDRGTGLGFDLTVPVELCPVIRGDRLHWQRASTNHSDQGLVHCLGGLVRYLSNQQQAGHPLNQGHNAGLFPRKPMDRVDFPVPDLFPSVDDPGPLINHPLVLLTASSIGPVMALSSSVALSELLIERAAALPVTAYVTIDRLIADPNAFPAQNP